MDAWQTVVALTLMAGMAMPLGAVMGFGLGVAGHMLLP